MKVLLIDVNCKNSSTGKIVYDLYTSLNQNGYTAAICYGRGPLVQGPLIYKFSTNIETYLHALLTRVTGLTGIYSPVATFKLIKFIKKFKPDVVHIHELHAYFVNIAPVIKYLKKKNIKTVWTFHCEFMYTGKCGHAYECEKWKSECHDCPQVKEYPKSLFFDFTKKMFNDKKELFMDFNNLTIVTPSIWLADRVKQSFLKDNDIRVIHNGIDTENIFYPRRVKHIKEKHNLTDQKLILSVAPNIMSEQKGGRLVLELAEKLKNENIKFILVGVEDLNEQFDTNVIAIGKTTNQNELAQYYSAADLFLICSNRENFPTTCIESLACGTPIIGFDEGGTKETAPKDYGRFVNYGRINSLYQVIKSIFNKEIKLNSNKHCAEFAKINYDRSIMVDKYINIYNEK